MQVLVPNVAQFYAVGLFFIVRLSGTSEAGSMSGTYVVGEFLIICPPPKHTYRVSALLMKNNFRNHQNMNHFPYFFFEIFLTIMFFFFPKSETINFFSFGLSLLALRDAKHIHIYR